jgi:c-di-GMP-binding flagellar brake protein YcgR
MRGDIAIVDQDRAIVVRVDPPDAVVLVPGAMVDVRFTRTRDASYRFTCEVRAKEAELVRLSFPRVIERVQHRRHVRAITRTAATFALAGPRAVDAVIHHGWITGTLNDLSASGVSLRTDVDVMINDVLLVRFELDGRKRPLVVDTRARVVRREPAGARFWRYGLELLDVPGSTEDELVGAVFHQLSQS